jgi:hypothetical protein
MTEINYFQEIQECAVCKIPTRRAQGTGILDSFVCNVCNHQMTKVKELEDRLEFDRKISKALTDQNGELLALMARAWNVKADNARGYLFELKHTTQDYGFCSQCREYFCEYHNS